MSLDNGDTITNPYDTANTFNNYFASVAETTKSIKHSHKDFSDYPLNESSSTKFLQFTDKEEIVSIISTLDSNKTSGPNSIPYRIFLLKMKFRTYWQIYSTSLSLLVFFHLYSKLKK